MQFRVLGPVEVVDAAGQPIDVGGTQPRALLAMLALAYGRVVPVDTLIEGLWPDRAPASASSTLQSYVSRLRRTLDPHRPDAAGKLISWEGSGYRLTADADEVDMRCFEHLADAGRAQLEANDVRGAHATLTSALALWRGPALAEYADQPWARGAATRLDERRLAVLEDRVRADLALGRHDVVVGELTDLVTSHPLREGLWEHLAIALYRSGRQADALRAIDSLRRELVESLGVDPSARIRDVESRILSHDPTLLAPVGDERGEHDRAITVDQPEAAIGVTTDMVTPDRRSRHIVGLSSTELVGRQAEREALAATLDLAVKGRTQWVLIEGEPGIGKTRLLEHIADEASVRGFDVLWGRTTETGAAPAFFPWLPALRTLAEMVPTLNPGTRELIERLLDPSEEDSATGPVAAGRFRVFEAISQLLERAAKQRPLLIALDDLQWADPASLELIEYLTGHGVGTPMVVASTVRELEIGRNDAVVQALANISRRPLTRRFRLDRVERHDSAELVRQAIGNAPSAEVVQAIHDRAEGNPFFIGELARLLAGEAGLTEAELIRRAAVPAGVRDVIHRRLSRLSAPTTELVQMAAVIGRDTSLGLLSRAAGIPVDQCIDDLEPAIVQRLIVEVPEARGAVQFAHALVREVVLDDMSALRRSRLHLRAADAIEATTRRADDTAELVAEHLWQAASLGVEARAAAAMELAAEVALRRYSYETADNLLERALQLRRDLPADQVDLHAELDTMNRLSVVRRVRFGFERARMMTPIARAKEIAKATGRDLVLAELLWTEWSGAATSCDLPLANRLAREMMELGERADDPLIRSSGLASWGISCWHEGRIGEAARALDEAVEILDEPLITGALPTGTIGGLVENEMLSRGHHVQIRSLAGRPFEVSPLPALAAAQDHPYVQLVIWVFEALRASIDEDLEGIERATSQAIGIEVGDEFEFFKSGAICLLGVSQLMAGRVADGIATINAGVARYQATGVLTVTPYYYAHIAEALLQAGDVPRAEQMVQRAAALIEQTDERWEEPFVAIVAAGVRAAQGAPADEVEALAARALAIAHGQEAFGSAAWVRRRAARLGIELPA